MKYKTLNFNNLNGQLNYRLNDKTLYYNVNGLNFEKSKLCLPIDFVISNEGYITNSLDIKLEKQDEDTYLITYPDKSKEKLDILYYYLNEKNERNYVNKKEIEIKPDGSLLHMENLLPYFEVLPFSDILFKNYIFSGIALIIVNGISNLIASYLIIKNKKSGLILGTVFGFTLMLWITIQFIIFPLNILSTSFFKVFNSPTLLEI